MSDTRIVNNGLLYMIQDDKEVEIDFNSDTWKKASAIMDESLKRLDIELEKDFAERGEK